MGLLGWALLLPSGSLQAQGTAPTLTCSDISISGGSCLYVVTLNDGVAVGGSPFPTLSYTIDGNPSNRVVVLQIGTYQVEITASNVHAVAVCAFTITIPDGRAPSIECPGYQELFLEGACSTNFVYTVAASDDCGALPPVVVCTPPSGSAFMLGETIVTCSATDLATNVSTCEFTVNVLISQGFPDQVVCLGETAYFHGTGGGPEPITYVWRKDGTILPGATNGLLVISNATALEEGVYEVEMTGPCGSATNSASLTVAFSDGSSGFVDVLARLPGLVGGSAAWGDYDKDGDLDLLVLGQSFDPSRITAVYEYRLGIFVENKQAALPGLSGGMAIWGDFNTNGLLDIVVTGTTNNSDSFTGFYTNNGTGGFSEQLSGLPHVRSGRVAAADYDKDGDLDIFISGRTPTGDVISRLMANNGAGMFTWIPGAVFAGFVAGDAEWADFDQDGFPDLLISGENDAGNAFTELYRNNQDGTFTEIMAGFPPLKLGTVAWADYNQDTFPDFILTGIDDGFNRSSLVFSNRTDGTFVDVTAMIGVVLPGVEEGATEWGDFNGDNFPDLFIAGSTSGGRFSELLQNNRDGTFSIVVGTGFPALEIPEAAWGDYDGNGVLDLLISGGVFEGEGFFLITQLFRQCPAAEQCQEFVTGYQPNYLRRDFTGWVGMRVTTRDYPVVVTRLARICIAGNSQPHVLKMVDADTLADVPGTTITVSLVGCTSEQFVWVDLPAPVTLAPRKAYYFVSQETAGGDQWRDVSTIVQHTDVASVKGAFMGGGYGWVLIGGEDHSYGPINFCYLNNSGIPRPPVISIVNPLDRAGIQGPATIRIDTAVVGNLTRVEFFEGLNKIGEVTSGPFNFPWLNVPPGAYALTARVTEVNGLIATSAIVNVVVTNAMPGGGGGAFIQSYISHTPRNDFAGWVGMKIKVGPTPIRVQALGRIFVTGNHGLHRVKIVRAADLTDLPGGTVSVPMSGGTAGSFKYVNLLAPLILEANTTYYIVSEESLSGDYWYDLDTKVTTTSVASVDGAVYSVGSAWIPLGAPNRSYGPVDFIYELAIGPVGPSVSIVSPITGDRFRLPTNITINAVASGGMLEVDFFAGASKLGTDLAAPFSFIWTNPPVGMHSLTAKATDTNGLMSTSAPVAVEVLPVLSGMLTSEVALVTRTLPGRLRNDFSGWVGFKLTVGPTPIQVVQLGRWIAPGNTRTHIVKLVDAVTHTDVPGASVTIATVGVTAGRYKYGRLAIPVTLAANACYFLVSEETAGIDSWHDVNSVLATTPVAAVNSGIFFGAGYGWSSAGAAGNAYVPVDLVHLGAPTPFAPLAEGGGGAGGGRPPDDVTTKARLENLRLNAAGCEITLVGESGRSHLVEWSDDLLHWQSLGRYELIHGRLTIEDNWARRSPRRFYRVK